VRFAEHPSGLFADRTRRRALHIDDTLREELWVAMTPERWRQITGLFHAALTRGEAGRSVFLASALRN
jgi:hypothetical protein